MEIEYSLDEKDYLEYLLYEGSKNKYNKKTKRKNWIIISSIPFLIYLIQFDFKDQFSLYYTIFLTLLILFLYPIFQKKQYKKYYIRTTNESYKNSFGELTKLIFNENNIEIFNLNVESKIKNEAFVAINEIENYIFLKTKGGSIVIPKLKISNLEDFKKHLKLMMQKYDIKENIELDWKWK